MKQVMLILLLTTLILSSKPVKAQWQKIVLPGSRGRAVYSLCVKDSLLFAGTRTGLFRSSDKGAHWVKVDPLFPPRYYNPLAVSLAINGKYLLAGFVESGIYMSTDNGESWEEKLVGKPRLTPYEIAASGNWVIAGYAVPLPNLSMQSTDNGENWTPLLIGNVISAAIQDSVALARTFSGIFRSTDLGATWKDVHPDSIIIASDGFPILFSGIHAYAGKSLPFHGNGYILCSSDKGLTWRDSSELPCSTINSIAVSPLDSNYVFAATDSGVFRSSDYGMNWTAVNNGLTSPLVFSLAFKVEKNLSIPILFAGTGDGIFYSADYGKTWTVTGSPSEWTFSAADNKLFAVSSNSSYSGVSIGNNQSENVFQTTSAYSTDNGDNWTTTFTGFLEDSSNVSSLTVNNDNTGQIHLFAGGAIARGYGTNNAEGIVFTSNDYGINWSKAYIGTSSYMANVLGANASNIFINLSATSIGEGGLFRTTDNGNSWVKVDTSFLSDQAICFNNDNIYVGGSNFKVIVGRPVKTFMASRIVTSTNDGETWEKIVTPFDSMNVSNNSSDTISAIASLNAAGSYLFIGMKAFYFMEDPYHAPIVNGGGLYRLYFDGSKWSVDDSAFIGRQIFGFAANGQNIFAATDSGVYRTINYGKSWDNISLGMNNLNISSLFISSSYLFASTTDGLWKCPLSEITSVKSNPSNDEVPSKFELFQNYPNPFNPSTIIKYQIPKEGFVTLKLYDILGNVVKTLVDGYKTQGEYSVNFNADNLASGVYFYQLRAGNFVTTKKLLLLK